MKRKTKKKKSRSREAKLSEFLLLPGNNYMDFGNFGLLVVNGVSFRICCDNVEQSARVVETRCRGNKLIFHVKKPKGDK